MDAAAHVRLREVLAALRRRQALVHELHPVQAARPRRHRLGERLPRATTSSGASAPRTSSRTRPPPGTPRTTTARTTSCAPSSTLFYEQSEKLNAVGGVELRLSSIGAKNVTSSTERPAETGSMPSPIAGDNQLASRDIGAYVQASYRPWTAAQGRARRPARQQPDPRHRRLRDRLQPARGASSTPGGDFVFKGIYARAFQDAPNFQKFETVSGVRELDNPTLAPERVTQLRALRELEAAHRLRRAARRLPRALRGHRGRGVGRAVPGAPGLPDDEPVPERRDASRSRGCRARPAGPPERFRLAGNYTYARPRDPDRDLRVGDIASHRDERRWAAGLARQARRRAAAQLGARPGDRQGHDGRPQPVHQDRRTTRSSAGR